MDKWREIDRSNAQAVVTASAELVAHEARCRGCRTGDAMCRTGRKLDGLLVVAIKAESRWWIQRP